MAPNASSSSIQLFTDGKPEVFSSTFFVSDLAQAPFERRDIRVLPLQAVAQASSLSVYQPNNEACTRSCEPGALLKISHC